MEAKLAEFRARKARISQGEMDKTKVQDQETKLKKSENDEILTTKPPENDSGYNTWHIQLPKCILESRIGKRFSNEKIAIRASFALKFILWIILWGLSIELEFGAVYFITSGLFLIYHSMKSGSRKDGEPSAYSVFNPDCERLDGTFTAEQFERELRLGAAAVR